MQKEGKNLQGAERQTKIRGSTEKNPNLSRSPCSSFKNKNNESAPALGEN
jgi:hypothetical protein